jgi:predicted DsbA family dithiol-disulfide isomerase
MALDARMTRHLKIDFVSDVSCPWCVIGLGGLDKALRRVGGLVEADIRFRPFELNPDMPPEGQDIGQHVAMKYGATPEQSAASRAAIKARAAEVGFVIASGPGSRIYNTYDAHRLLHWAAIEGRQYALKRALFEAYFTHGRNPADHEVLADAAGQAGLDVDAAREVLASGRYAEEVRADERHWREEGINAVPTVIIDDRFVISGGQPADAFERALRKIAAMAV